MKKISIYNIASILSSLFLLILGLIMFSLSCNFSSYEGGSFNIKFSKEYLFMMISGLISLFLSIYVLIKKIEINVLDIHTLGYVIGVPGLIMFIYYLGKMIDLCINKQDPTSSIIKMVLSFVVLVWGIAVLSHNKRLEID